jgi:hypothetical protein
MEKIVHTIKFEDLPQDRMILKRIYIKPYTAIYTILAAGAALLIFRTQVWFLGIILVALSLFALFFVNNHLQLEICDDYAVLYSDSTPGQCQVFHWSEVIEWGIKHEASGDFLSVRLKDGDLIHTAVNNSSTVYRALNHQMPKQESSYRLHERINEKRNAPSKFKWPWQRKMK